MEKSEKRHAKFNQYMDRGTENKSESLFASSEIWERREVENMNISVQVKQIN